jgi:hypothetical protein
MSAALALGSAEASRSAAVRRRFILEEVENAFVYEFMRRVRGFSGQELL